MIDVVTLRGSDKRTPTTRWLTATSKRGTYSAKGNERMHHREFAHTDLRALPLAPTAIALYT